VLFPQHFLHNDFPIIFHENSFSSWSKTPRMLCQNLRGPNLDFSGWWLKALSRGRPTVVKFNFTNSKLREKHFPSETLLQTSF